MTKILVTGGAGFIGSNFIKYVKENTKIEIVGVIDKLTYAAKKERVEELHIPLIQLDICNSYWDWILYAYNPDIVVNFAASSHVDRSIVSGDSFIKSNYIGVYEIVKGIIEYNKSRKKCTKLLHISTDETMGHVSLDKYERFYEHSPLQPNNPYSATKAAADLLIHAMHHTHKNFSYAIARPTNNYGLNQHDEKFIPTVIRNALKYNEIPIYGDGLNKREWLYTLDLAEGLVKLIEYMMERSPNFGEIFNFGSGIRLSNIALAKKIIHIIGDEEKRLPLLKYIQDRPGHDLMYAVDSCKAKDILGWVAKTTLEEGLKEVIKAYAS